MCSNKWSRDLSLQVGFSLKKKNVYLHSDRKIVGSNIIALAAQNPDIGTPVPGTEILQKDLRGDLAIEVNKFATPEAKERLESLKSSLMSKEIEGGSIIDNLSGFSDKSQATLDDVAKQIFALKQSIQETGGSFSVDLQNSINQLSETASNSLDEYNGLLHGQIAEMLSKVDDLYASVYDKVPPEVKDNIAHGTIR